MKVVRIRIRGNLFNAYLPESVIEMASTTYFAVTAIGDIIAVSSI